MLMLRTACIDTRTSSVCELVEHTVDRSRPAFECRSHLVGRSGRPDRAQWLRSTRSPDDDVDARHRGTSDEGIEVGGGEKRHVARHDDHVIGGVGEVVECRDDPAERTFPGSHVGDDVGAEGVEQARFTADEHDRITSGEPEGADHAGPHRDPIDHDQRLVAPHP